LGHFAFEHPTLFILALTLLCLVLCPIALSKSVFVHTQLLKSHRRFIDTDRLLYAVILLLFITALASPFYFESHRSNNKKGRDLVVAIDASGSMAQSGFSSKAADMSRFELIKLLLGNFVKHRYDDNVGVSIFGSFGYAAVPLTYDMQAITYLLRFINVGIAGENTAIGEGLYQALRILEQGEAKHKVIILITDGFANSGQLAIKDVVNMAVKNGVKIYTIGIGAKSDYDSALLEKIAKRTAAQSFRASDASALSEVYDALDTLEPSAIRSENYLNIHRLFFVPLGFAALLLLYIMRKKRAL